MYIKMKPTKHYIDAEHLQAEHQHHFEEYFEEYSSRLLKKKELLPGEKNGEESD